MRRRWLDCIVLSVAGLLSCGPAERAASGQASATRRAPGEPDRVRVQALVLDVEAADLPPGGAGQPAERVAHELLARALRGEELAELARQHGGTASTMAAGLTNSGAPSLGEFYPRAAVPPEFGDAAFSLAIGQVVLVPPGPDDGRRSWILLRRVE